MDQTLDLYSILVSYGAKSNPILIKEDALIDFFERQAGKLSGWEQNVQSKVHTALQGLEKEGKVEILHDERGKRRIFLIQLCRELIRQRYQNPGDIRSFSFPSEESLGIRIPANRVLQLEADSDMGSLMELSEKENQKGKEAFPIIKVLFREDFGSALILPDMIPQKLLEASFYKIQNYLQNKSNKDYLFLKMAVQYKGKEAFLKRVLDDLEEHPQENYEHLVEGDELYCIFWSQFCSMIKKDILERNSHISDDIGAFEGVYFVEAANYYFKNKTALRKSKEDAFKELEKCFLTSPFIFSKDDIVKFIGPNGIPLINIYTHTDLDEWLRKKISEDKDDKMPDILKVKGPEKASLFVHKRKVLYVCSREVTETKDKVRDMVSKRWGKVLSNYGKEASMSDDRAFNILLRKYTMKIDPFLIYLLDDLRIRLVYSEMESQKELPPDFRIFNNGILIPFDRLFKIDKRELLFSVRSSLPLRYSLPFLVAIINFFRKLGFGKRDTALEKELDQEMVDLGKGNRKSALDTLEISMVPKGYTLDSYLKELEGRWMRLTGKEEQEGLLSDVNNLIKNYFRQVIRSRKRRIFSREELTEMAASLVEWNPTLRSLNGKEAFIKYTELYFVKLLKKVKTIG